MKFLETLGRYQGQKGVFQYKRGSNGVTIRWDISNNQTIVPQCAIIYASQWHDILCRIEAANGQTFGLTVGGGAGNPTTSLYELISQVLPTQNTSVYAYVCAILEHEGSIETYTGALGPSYQSRIDLVRDIP